MGKYYVVSGDIRVMICAPHVTSPEDAACEAMLQYFNDGVCPAPIVIVSERGFDFNLHEINEDKCFGLDEILEKAGFTIEGEDEYESL